jgi:hypothetical protein
MECLNRARGQGKKPGRTVGQKTVRKEENQDIFCGKLKGDKRKMLG